MVLNADSWHEERLLIDGELVEAEGGATYDEHQPGQRRGHRRRRRCLRRPTSSEPSRPPAGPSTRPTGRATCALRVRGLRQLHQAIARPPGRAGRHHRGRGRRAPHAHGRPAARRAAEVPALLRRPGRALRVSTSSSARPTPWPAGPTAGSRRSRSASSPPSRPGTTPTRSTSPRSRPPSPPAAPWC